MNLSTSMAQRQEKNDKIAELEKQVAKAGRYEKKASASSRLLNI